VEVRNSPWREKKKGQKKGMWGKGGWVKSSEKTIGNKGRWWLAKRGCEVRYTYSCSQNRKKRTFGSLNIERDEWFTWADNGRPI